MGDSTKIVLKAWLIPSVCVCVLSIFVGQHKFLCFFFVVFYIFQLKCFNIYFYRLTILWMVTTQHSDPVDEPTDQSRCAPSAVPGRCEVHATVLGWLGLVWTRAISTIFNYTMPIIRSTYWWKKTGEYANQVSQQFRWYIAGNMCFHTIYVFKLRKKQTDTQSREKEMERNERVSEVNKIAAQLTIMGKKEFTKKKKE